MMLYLRRALFCVPLFCLLLALSLLGTAYPSAPAQAGYAQNCSMISDTVVVGGESQANLDSYRSACFLCQNGGGTFYWDGGGGDVHGTEAGPLTGHCQAGTSNRGAANGSNAAAQAHQRAQQLLGYAPAAPVVRAPTPVQRSLAISGNALSMGANFLANQAAEEEQAQADADAQAAQDEADRQTAEDARRAQEQQADAARRAALCNAFDGSCNAPGGNNSQQVASNGGEPNPFGAASPQDDGNANPFAQQTARRDPTDEVLNPGGGPTDITGRPLPTSDADPSDPSRPDRKLGDPKQADKLAYLTRSGCDADKGEVIELPNSAAYCVIAVDNPEPTNEWHHLTEDAPKKAKKPQIKSPGAAVMGVRG